MAQALQYGYTFPHESIGDDQDGVRELVGALEAAGYDYLAIAEHVLGADSVSRPDWKGPYDATDCVRELFVLMGFMAGFTRLELVSSILVLPQRQTPVVAKQAAEVDLLTGGKLRLGIGVGWNPVEYEALGIDFHTRGARCEEQIEVLRQLWTKPVVTFEGKFHSIDRAGINPLPQQRPIPIWLGGGGRKSLASDDGFDLVLDRIGRIGDGWICGKRFRAPSDVAGPMRAIRASAEKAGRDPDAIGLQASIEVFEGDDLSPISAKAEQLHRAGVTHVSIEMKHSGFSLEHKIDLVSEVGALMRFA